MRFRDLSNFLRKKSNEAGESEGFVVEKGIDVLVAHSDDLEVVEMETSPHRPEEVCLSRLKHVVDLDLTIASSGDESELETIPSHYEEIPVVAHQKSWKGSFMRSGLKKQSGRNVNEAQAAQDSMVEDVQNEAPKHALWINAVFRSVGKVVEDVLTDTTVEKKETCIPSASSADAMENTAMNASISVEQKDTDGETTGSPTETTNRSVLSCDIASPDPSVSLDTIPHPVEHDDENMKKRTKQKHFVKRLFKIAQVHVDEAPAARMTLQHEILQMDQKTEASARTLGNSTSVPFLAELAECSEMRCRPLDTEAVPDRLSLSMRVIAAPDEMNQLNLDAMTDVKDFAERSVDDGTMNDDESSFYSSPESVISPIAEAALNMRECCNKSASESVVSSIEEVASKMREYFARSAVAPIKDSGSKASDHINHDFEEMQVLTKEDGSNMREGCKGSVASPANETFSKASEQSKRCEALELSIEKAGSKIRGSSIRSVGTPIVESGSKPIENIDCKAPQTYARMDLIRSESSLTAGSYNVQYCDFDHGGGKGGVMSNRLRVESPAVFDDSTFVYSASGINDSFRMPMRIIRVVPGASILDNIYMRKDPLYSNGDFPERQRYDEDNSTIATRLSADFHQAP
jgi:hypothetical protein